jgi:hypothetical protein
MTTYTIETGIPIPTPRGGHGSGRKGPLTDWTKLVAALDVGQSVMTPEYREFKAADQWVARQKPKQYAIRKIPGQGWRVWRTL